MEGIYFLDQPGDAFIAFPVAAKMDIGKLDDGEILEGGGQVFHWHGHFLQFIVVSSPGNAVKQKQKQACRKGGGDFSEAFRNPAVPPSEHHSDAVQEDKDEFRGIEQ